jgi:hypothetical protein
MTDRAAVPSKAASKVSLIARADFQYRWRVWAFFVMVCGYGIWSARDGFIKWPQDNARNQALRERGLPPPQVDHNYASIVINRVLGFLLPTVSLPVFVWLMYRSRGSYRLADGTLSVPGRQPIPVERIQALDKSRFDRKGLAVVEYQKPDGGCDSVILRDMVYERRTTDDIVDWIENYLRNGESTATPHPNSLPEGEGVKASST